MNVNKTIHEAMGFCWHENVEANKEITPGWFYCIDCGVFVGDTLPIPLIDFPDYTDPINYCALMDWMYEEYKWEGFHKWCLFSVQTERLDRNRAQLVTLIAEAIEAGVLK